MYLAVPAATVIIRALMIVQHCNAKLCIPLCFVRKMGSRCSTLLKCEHKENVKK